MPHDPTSAALPSIQVGPEATTDDCKELLSGLPESAYGAGSPAGAWKRVSKRGSGARVEREFVHKSGLRALVVQSGRRLSVEALAASSEELAAKAAGVAAAPREEAADADEPSGSLRVAHAPAKALAEARAVMDAQDGDAYYHYAQKVGKTPAGSAERLAFGNMFTFAIPGVDDSGIFIIQSRTGWPESASVHWLEEVYGYNDIESPNESCDHWVHREPADAIEMLLSSGMAYVPPQPGEAEDPDYAAPMRARLLARDEALALDAAAGQGAQAGRRPGI